MFWTRFELSQSKPWKNADGGSHADIHILPVALRSAFYGAKTLRGVAGSNVSAPLRSVQNRGPLDLVHRLALKKKRTYAKHRFFSFSVSRSDSNSTKPNTGKNKNGGSHAEILVLPAAFFASVSAAKMPLRGRRGFECLRSAPVRAEPRSTGPRAPSRA